MTAQTQSQTTIQPHRYSHLPIPTEEEMEKIIDLICQQTNPQILKEIEEVTPPHIMKALVAFAERRADEAEAWAREVKIWRQEVESTTNKARLLEESINKRLGLQMMN